MYKVRCQLFLNPHLLFSQLLILNDLRNIKYHCIIDNRQKYFKQVNNTSIIYIDVQLLPLQYYVLLPLLVYVLFLLLTQHSEAKNIIW